MADDINKVLLVGRLTRDAELMYTNNGYALCKFSIAVNQRKKQGEQWVDVAHYFDVNLWGRRGEGLHPYLAKGTQVAIEGALRQQRWEQDGLKKSRITIDAANVELLGGNRDGSGSSGGQRSTGNHSGNPRPQNGHNQSGSMAKGQQSRGRQAQSGGRDSYQEYTPPDQPTNDYEDDIPF
jgi:single-strand DNA-binding protein